jgi:ADP-heptose:LPS heptosyltransferase
MNYVLKVEGGVGKHIMATSLVRWINLKYPESKIIVASSFPEIFENNPRVHRTLSINQAYLFEDYIKGNDWRQGEPYAMFEYYNDLKHFCELLPKAYLFGEYDAEWKTELYPTKGELAEAETYPNNIITIQATGGANNQPSIQMRKDVGGKDIPIELAHTIAVKLTEQGFKVVQIRGPNEPVIPGVEQFTGHTRQLMALATKIVAHVGIDSLMMHICGALNKPMLILWGETSPKNLGYSYAKNIVLDGSSRPHVGLPDGRYCIPYKESKDVEVKEEDINKWVAELVGAK